MPATLHGCADKSGGDGRAEASAATGYPHSGIHPQRSWRPAAVGRLLFAGDDGDDDERQDAEEQAQDSPPQGAAALHPGDDRTDDGRDDAAYRDEDALDPAQD